MHDLYINKLQIIVHIFDIDIPLDNIAIMVLASLSIYPVFSSLCSRLFHYCFVFEESQALPLKSKHSVSAVMWKCRADTYVHRFAGLERRALLVFLWMTVWKV